MQSVSLANSRGGWGAVGEKDEVSIKDVADAIVKAVGFEGDYSVKFANWRGECSTD